MPRKLGWIKTYTGRYVEPLHLTAKDVEIEDIAHALSNQCRFTGHTDRFYSVATHSTYVAQVIRQRYGGNSKLSLWGLLHDASEAYLVDLPSPLKNDPRFGKAFRDVEARIMRAVCERFELPLEEPAIVREVDRAMLCTEARDLMGHTGDPWYEESAPLPFGIIPESPAVAETRFLQRFYSLRVWAAAS